MSKFKVINPYDNSVYGEFDYHDRQYVQDVLAKLKQGQKIQHSLTAFERANILNKLADLFESKAREVGEIITQEMGKTISDSIIELQRSANTARVSADECSRSVGEVLDSDAYPPKRNRMGIIRRQPMGIVMAITPFNFPINLSMHKIGPAFAAGNTIFFKPGPQNYFSAKKLVELCYEAGMPQEVIQLCCPDIPELTEVIKGNDIQCISFTGGTATADAIAKNAGRKKLLFELGGNDPLIVMDDADIDKAAQTAVDQRFATAGQRCTASKRVFVHNKIYESFKKSLVRKAKKLIIGDPMDDQTFVGPLVSKQAADNVERRVKTAIEQEGAHCLLGGKREGNIIHPTILENVSLNSEIICDETFGPVIPLIKFDSVDEVIPIINSTGFGLQSGVFTNQLDIIQKLYDQLDVGALAVNDGPGFRAEHFPFGGVKNSGLGREGVRFAIDEMSYLKTLIM